MPHCVPAKTLEPVHFDFMFTTTVHDVVVV